MVRSMIFGSGLELMYWSEPAEGQEPDHVQKKVESDHQVAEESDAQPKESLPLGPRRSQRKHTKSIKQAVADEYSEGSSMEKREKVSSPKSVSQGECTNVGELESSVEELQVSDPVLMAFAVLPADKRMTENSRYQTQQILKKRVVDLLVLGGRSLRKRKLRHPRQTKRGR
ncbi:hypothetical protein ABG067_006361 [Albugo candida]